MYILNLREARFPGDEVDKNHQETCGAEQNNETNKQIKTIKPLGS